MRTTFIGDFNKLPSTVFQKTNSVKKVAFKTRKKSFKNTPFGDTSFCNTLNSTNYSEQSMDLTAPVESEIVVKKPTKKTKYAIKKRDQKKKTKRNAEKKGKKTQKLDDTITEKDIYDNSADSFLLNPEKKIEVREIFSFTNINRSSGMWYEATLADLPIAIHWRSRG